MASFSQLLPTLFLLSLASLFSPSQPAALCTPQRFSGDKDYTFCNDLPALNAYIQWAYDEARSELSVAFTAPPAQPDGWISWAINPTGSGMKGSQALIAFRDAKGEMTVKTYNVSSYDALAAESEVVWYEVKESAAEFSGGVMRLFATLVLPVKGVTVVNHVWQVGSSVTLGAPEEHGFDPDNLSSKGSLDLLSGSGAVEGGGDSRTKKKYIHGIVNVISWGMMFPAGVITARYLRVFPSAGPAWFYLHVSCQVTAYTVGVAGWGTGLKLGGESKGITYSSHRNIGIALFVLATIQIFALVFRPQKDDKQRLYWNIYHHVIGYSIIVLGIINVFKGLGILGHQRNWRTAYVFVIAALGGVAAFLEAITWFIVLRRKKKSSDSTSS
ncbi:Auxin-responsive family protein [Perilla frutescens var. hirtella]|nr:Auxin-responsive family protein [Perilla frutescens var. hirtella]